MGIAETVLQEWKKRDPFLSDIQGYGRYFEKRFPVLQRQAEREAERQMKLLVRVFAAPIIVHKCGWMDTVPEWLLKWIKLDRMIALMKNKYDGVATDSEALAYLVPAALEFPMGYDWTQIYLYLATKVIRQSRHAELPKDVVVETLSDYHQGMLKGLKRWIWNQQDKALRERKKKNNHNV